MLSPFDNVYSFTGYSLFCREKVLNLAWVLACNNGRLREGNVLV